MCGLVVDNRGNRKVVIACGEESAGQALASVESFNLQTMQWYREEIDFPFTPVWHPRNIQWGRTFLSVGGYNPETGDADFIYRYDPENNNWDRLPVVLEKSLRSAA